MRGRAGADDCGGFEIIALAYPCAGNESQQQAAQTAGLPAGFRLDIIRMRNPDLEISRAHGLVFRPLIR